MSASEYIPLFVHPDHPKILRLAELTGETKFSACGRAVAWFRWIDQNLVNEFTALAPAAVNSVVSCRTRKKFLDFCAAIQDKDIRWLSLNDEGLVVVAKFEKYFGKSSRRRYLEARRALKRRQHERAGSYDNSVRTEPANRTDSSYDGDADSYAQSGGKAAEKRPNNSEVRNLSSLESSNPIGESPGVGDDGGLPAATAAALKRLGVNESSWNKFDLCLTADTVLRTWMGISHNARSPIGLLVSQLERPRGPLEVEHPSPKHIAEAIAQGDIIFIDGAAVQGKEARYNADWIHVGDPDNPGADLYSLPTSQIPTVEFA